MKTDELREKYLAFFETKGCVRRPSDVLVPTWDPSVLFTPAGMNQFKDHFLGKVTLDFTRATTCQKCLRTGDIDNVGRTAYHHTFFEMLGNFSFGDYFKEDTIRWAWEFLTDKKWLGLDPGRLSVTVYKDDDEAAKIWHEGIGLPTSRIARMEEDENFWPASAPSQGPDGVCGPCSEIYYVLDDGSDVEIWNLVFTQFNRVGDPPDNLRPLPSKNIDTGMGLERTASVLQKVPTNYHIDILMPIVQAAAEVTSVPYEYDSDNGRRLRRITDHVRAATFAVHENVYPGANGAKYVIRRLIRRAVLDGHQMGLRDPFLYQIVDAVADAMKPAYPELTETVQRVQGVIRGEEERFFATIDAGLQRIDRIFGDMETSGTGMIDGDQAADLYTSYGVPPELLQQMGAEKSFTFDWNGYTEAMQRHAEISGGDQFKLFQTGPLETLKESLRHTEFLGYDATTAEATIKGIIIGDGTDDDSDESTLVKSASADPDQPMRLVLDRTPFYGESGGQVGDVGVIRGDGFEFNVTDTQKHGDLVVHHGRLVKGKVSESDACQAIVDQDNRQALQRAHSATHILHYALQKNVGAHAQQQGSKVEADVLRFDFSNQEALDEDKLAAIRTDVIDRVQAKDPIRWQTVALADARKAGAMMLFGEKYPDPVRMVSMGEFSKELCGGTHLTSTGDVEAFELVSEESVSSGTRRIVALTGPRAKSHIESTIETTRKAAEILGCSQKNLVKAATDLANDVRGIKKELNSGVATEHAASIVGNADPGTLEYEAAKAILRDTARLLNVATSDVPDRLKALLDDRSDLLDELQKMTAGGKLSADDLIGSGQTVGDCLIVVAETPGANPNIMRGWIDQIRKKSDHASAVLLAARQGEKVLLVGGLSNDLVKRGLNAGKWVGNAAKALGGGGGGRPDMAQAGGKDASKLPEALDAAIAEIQAALSENA
ncbi:alanine--tRNA ligase [Crateriforma conspicua]|uniref:alanine--tRNA ligase n=1 Tax=Crateriforma conspicua TaxID=2527996 RepID=UPI0011885078|nr:alanine--tRNA ligase [Crateriforma conspicua]QDV63743.1 Alanine--tRNA ligase [Crateriforma conspicua]